VITTSSWKATVWPVARVTVAPTGTLIAAPFPLAIVFARRPSWSNTSRPMSATPAPRFVHVTRVSRLLRLWTEGSMPTRSAGRPVLNTGRGESPIPARTDRGAGDSNMTPSATSRTRFMVRQSA
jgi:hypothetical protein